MTREEDHREDQLEDVVLTGVVAILVGSLERFLKIWFDFSNFGQKGRGEGLVFPLGFCHRIGTFDPVTIFQVKYQVKF